MAGKEALKVINLPKLHRSQESRKKANKKAPNFWKTAWRFFVGDFRDKNRSVFQLYTQNLVDVSRRLVQKVIGKVLDL
jgi:hypothetical protein